MRTMCSSDFHWQPNATLGESPSHPKLTGGFTACNRDQRRSASGRVPVYAAGFRRAAVRRTPEVRGQTAKQPECAVQQSAASVRWAVLDGHHRILMNDRYGVIKRPQ